MCSFYFGNIEKKYLFPLLKSEPYKNKIILIMRYTDDYLIISED
jgi:hypothetical protein